MALNQHQRDFFLENGYVSYGPMLDEANLAELRCAYDAVFEQAQRENTFRNLALDDGGNSDEKLGSEVKMLQVMQACERHLAFRKLVYHPAMLDVLEQLIGPTFLLFHDQLLWKPAFTGGPVFWHQDNAYWKATPANLVSCWLTLDDVDVSNGAMQFVPGSHLKPVWHEQSDSTNALLNVESQVDKSKVKTVELPAGGALFHHCQTLHYTQPNSTPRQRRAVAIHCCVPGTTFQSGEKVTIGWNRPLLRARM